MRPKASESRSIAISSEIRACPLQIEIELVKHQVVGDRSQSFRSYCHHHIIKDQWNASHLQIAIAQNVESPVGDHPLCFFMVIGDSFMISCHCWHEICGPPMTGWRQRSRLPIFLAITCVTSPPGEPSKISGNYSSGEYGLGQKRNSTPKKSQTLLFNKKSNFLYANKFKNMSNCIFSLIDLNIMPKPSLELAK